MMACLQKDGVGSGVSLSWANDSAHRGPVLPGSGCRSLHITALMRLPCFFRRICLSIQMPKTVKGESDLVLQDLAGHSPQLLRPVASWGAVVTPPG